MKRINNDWKYLERWNDAFLTGDADGETVRLPHTPSIAPLHYSDPGDYERVCGYARELSLPGNLNGKRVFLQLDGAAHIADVYLNGEFAGQHRSGYTAFRTELTRFAKPGANRLCVRLDSTENPAVPPFGHVIDYLTYGGLYRDAWLDIRPETYISDVFVYTPSTDTAAVQVEIDGGTGGERFRVSILEEKSGREVHVSVHTPQEKEIRLKIPDVTAWTPDVPALYECRVELLDDNNAVADSQRAVFGFRTAQFKADGFYLNGEKTFLRGLNRHQCYPYAGYAVPETLQREDARILREELGCTAVRTSHYPQSQYFIDECDRIGLLVFTEIPGWQHIGDEKWKEQACLNTREMVLQYRNHPSIILWGVRINESQDDDGLYKKTNAIAHELDPSRATSGVRYIEKSSLLEDVYAFNDFSHTGNNAGCKKRSTVMKDPKHPFLISEHDGHMFPTKSFDTWSRRQEHAMRHARVLNDAMADGEHAGCFGWCMFDYATHKDFGSGDRICYHGVLDAFRNPKPAAALYASQSNDRPVLEVMSSMDIGDYPGGQIGTVYVLTNADEVALYKNNAFVGKLKRTELTALEHPPLVLDDTIGELLQSQEGFPAKKAARLRRALNAAAKHGTAGMTLRDKLLFADCMLRYHMTMDDGMALYGKYVGNWGDTATVWRFDAIRAGKVIASVTRGSTAKLSLECIPSHTVLHEGGSWDMACVRVRVKDGFGNLAPYAQLPLTFETQGPIETVGPETGVAEGGSTGVYIRTTGEAGEAFITISSPQTEPVRLRFSIIKA